MKKIYSFVLMAAMLLVGTNAWAAGSLITDVQAAFDSETATGYQLQPNGDLEYLQFNGQLVFGQDKHFVLDLNGLTLKMNNNDKVGILVNRGTLEIKNGTITNVNGKTIDLIRVIGANTTGWNAANGNTYSRLIIDANAYVVNNSLITSGTKYNALTITENPTKVGGLSYANGARIDVYGTATSTDDDANVQGYTYGIKVNGSIKRPASDDDAAYVYIHSGALVTAHSTNSGSVAAYSSGFARWRIEGICSASTGLYVKGGQVDVASATITSAQSTAVAPTTGGKSGVDAGGSAIVIESNSNYPGDISVTVSGTSTIEGAGGYAIEETIASNVTNTEVEAISIQGGTLSGGTGAIIVDDKTADEVVVVGGTINGDVTIDNPQDPDPGKTTKTVSIEEFVNGTNNIDNPGQSDLDYIIHVTDATAEDPVQYIVEPNTTKVVTMNAYGWSTFSATVARDLVSGLTAYKAAYSDEGDVQKLTLTEFSGTIPAEEGVILYGEPNKTYSLNAKTTDPTNLLNNDLAPASDWSAMYANKQNYDFYVLHDNQMYLYTGETMKANKAYLPIYKGSGDAPKRIQMVIAETQDIENVEFEAVKAVKFIENGQVLIKRGEKVYNVQGQIVK